jgi:hypothetical protein
MYTEIYETVPYLTFLAHNLYEFYIKEQLSITIYFRNPAVLFLIADKQ